MLAYAAFAIDQIIPAQSPLSLSHLTYRFGDSTLLELFYSFDSLATVIIVFKGEP